MKRAVTSVGGVRIVVVCLLALVVPCAAVSGFQLEVTETWSGQDGTDLTEDWFEITNKGATAWQSAVDGGLYYDDESQDPAAADPIEGITAIAPGEVVVVVIGGASDVTTFTTVWGPDIDLTGVQVGSTDGAGLGQGGDGVAIWVGDPTVNPVVDFGTYPDGIPSGVSYDLDLGAASTVGNASGAVQTTATAGTSGTEPAIGSPGQNSIVPVELQSFSIQ